MFIREMTFAGEPQTILCGPSLDESIEEATTGPAVFLIHTEGEPYLGRTNVFRRRLKRLLRPAEAPSKSVRLRDLARRIEFWPVGSRLESTLVLYELAVTLFPDRYSKILKLRFPYWLKLITAIDFPRTQVTSRLSGRGHYFGPFRSRASAELFEHEALSLFQMRRCQDDLAPDPEHPGCIYGEMSMCLRPCQQVVGISEYASESARVYDFLSTGGRQLRHSAEAARDRSSADLDYEEAARQHKRIERIDSILKLRDDAVAELPKLNGVAVTPSVVDAEVNLWFMHAGVWQPVQRFSVAWNDASTSMDRRLKELVSTVFGRPHESPAAHEHIAIFSRWFYSSWRDGEWLPFEAPARLSYRKLVGAVSRCVEPRATGKNEPG